MAGHGVSVRFSGCTSQGWEHFILRVSPDVRDNVPPDNRLTYWRKATGDERFAKYHVLIDSAA